MLNIGEKGKGGVWLWSKGERRGGSHQNPKPQACVGETMGVQGGVGGGGGEALPTSEAASLGAQAAEIWPGALEQLSLSCCRPGDVGRRRGGCCTFKRDGTITASTVVSLQRPPPPLIFTVRIGERSRKRRSKKKGGSKEAGKKSKEEDCAAFGG